MPNIFGVEVFAPGTWNDRTFTEADLSAAVEGYEATRGIHRAPLKLGHNEKQVLAQADGQPALGWVENFRVLGGKLLADLIGMPTVVYEAVKQRRYRKVSMEFWLDIPWEAGKLAIVPKALALLGADLPAVTDLKGLDTYLSGTTFSQAASASFSMEVIELPANDEPDFKVKETKMEKAEMKALLDEALKPIQEAQGREIAGIKAEFAAKDAAKDAEIEKLRKEQGAALERQRVAEFSAQAKPLKAQFEEKVKTGLLTPALRDKVFAAIDAQQTAFPAGGQVNLPLELLGEVLSAASAKLPQGEAAEHGVKFAAADPGTELDKLTKATMAKAKLEGRTLGYSEAMAATCEANAALAKAYNEAGYAAEPNVSTGRVN